MFDVNRILDALQNDPNTQRTAMGVGGGAAAGLAAGMLMGKSGRKMVGKAAKYGAVAALGGLAYHAWTRSRQQATEPAGAGAASAPPAPAPSVGDYQAPPAGTPFALPAAEAEQDALGKALVRAMIAAAKSDGKIDAEEKSRIFERLNAMDLDANAKAFVFDELSAPLDLNAVIEPATSPELAAEIYAASLVAIEADTPAEKAYLQMLAARLNLEPALVTELHIAAEAAPPA